MQLAEEENINIYTDRRYAFATAHIHWAIYRQRGLLTSAGEDIKNKEEILSLLEAIHLPKRKKLAIIHCPGHQKGHDAIAKGNQMADLAAKQAAQRAMILIAREKNKELKDHYELKDAGFDYTPEDQELTGKIPEICRYTPQGVAKTQDGHSVLPTKLGQ